MAKRGTNSGTEPATFLTNLRDNFARYHTRKESMAWLATTIYLGGILALGNLFIDGGVFKAVDVNLGYGVLSLILLTFVLTLAFIKKQLSDRTVAAHIVASCNDVLAYFSDPEFKLTSSQLNTHKYEEGLHWFYFPEILVRQLKAREHKPRYFLWNYISPYAVITVWTLAAEAFIIYAIFLR